LRIAVIDSSALINLAHLELADELSLYFNIVYVSSSVQKEVNRKGRFRYRLAKLYRTGKFERCSAVDRANMDILREELDEGEAESLAQATERGATYFIADETPARNVAAKRGLNLVGTARLVARLCLDDRVTNPERLLRKLRRDRGFRILDSVIEAAIAKAPVPI
jgi:predicted nucleic acid-binding protein